MCCCTRCWAAPGAETDSASVALLGRVRSLRRRTDTARRVELLDRCWFALRFADIQGRVVVVSGFHIGASHRSGACASCRLQCISVRPSALRNNASTRIARSERAAMRRLVGPSAGSCHSLAVPLASAGSNDSAAGLSARSTQLPSCATKKQSWYSRPSMVAAKPPLRSVGAKPCALTNRHTNRRAALVSSAGNSIWMGCSLRISMMRVPDLLGAH